MLWIIMGLTALWLALLAGWVWLYLFHSEPPPDLVAQHIDRMARRYDRAARLD